MSPKPLVFSGEFDVEDDEWECIVERFIVRGDSYAFQLSGFDSVGGKYDAEGAAERRGPVIVTTAFQLRYKVDSIDTPASFHIAGLALSPKGLSLTVSALWTQGDTWKLEANLPRMTTKSKRPSRTDG